MLSANLYCRQMSMTALLPSLQVIEFFFEEARSVLIGATLIKKDCENKQLN